ncbi:outer membrane lipoprotein carrier protein LolA [bacterium]|nr:outer membrane lipoprotein carrier protein LolA [bacterium]
MQNVRSQTMLISTHTWMPAQTNGFGRAICKIFSFLTFAGIGLAQTTARAAESEKNSDSSISSELKQLQIKASKHDSFKVKFDQTVFSALRKKTTRSEGELVFSQPRKFRWEIITPNRELYVNNGEWFWKYVENTKHAVRLPANSGVPAISISSTLSFNSTSFPENIRSKNSAG